jgi:hypothetical protein
MFKLSELFGVAGKVGDVVVAMCSALTSTAGRRCHWRW